MGVPSLRAFIACAHQTEACPIGLERRDQDPHTPVCSVTKRHRLVMHRILEIDVRRSEKPSADDYGRFQFGSGGEKDSSGNFVIGKVACVVRTVTCLIADLL